MMQAAKQGDGFDARKAGYRGANRSLRARISNPLYFKIFMLLFKIKPYF